VAPQRPPPSPLSWASSSPAQTERAGAALAAPLRPGDVVLVDGDLGAGKTTLVRGACRALGVTAPVTSPTYTIGHLHPSPRGQVAHLDLYRARAVTAEEWGDLEPYFDGTIAFVEWPAAGAGVLPPARARVTIRVAEGDARLISIDVRDRELADALGHPLA
jgi:tRNA threonylcarbamoyladenosine biosynthesis protein TsaE